MTTRFIFAGSGGQGIQFSGKQTAHALPAQTVFGKAFSQTREGNVHQIALVIDRDSAVQDLLDLRLPDIFAFLLFSEYVEVLLRIQLSDLIFCPVQKTHKSAVGSAAVPVRLPLLLQPGKVFDQFPFVHISAQKIRASPDRGAVRKREGVQIPRDPQPRAILRRLQTVVPVNIRILIDLDHFQGKRLLGVAEVKILIADRLRQEHADIFHRHFQGKTQQKDRLTAHCGRPQPPVDQDSQTGTRPVKRPGRVRAGKCCLEKFSVLRVILFPVIVFYAEAE